jgi:hypothetical protein
MTVISAACCSDTTRTMVGIAVLPPWSGPQATLAVIRK